MNYWEIVIVYRVEEVLAYIVKLLWSAYRYWKTSFFLSEKHPVQKQWGFKQCHVVYT